MDKVIGDRTRQQGTDLSKIQARFSAKVKLDQPDVEEASSASGSEKNDAGAAELIATIHAQRRQLQDDSTSSTGEDPSQLRRRQPFHQHTYPFARPTRSRCSRLPSRASDHNMFEGNEQLGRRTVHARCRSRGPPSASGRSRLATPATSTRCSGSARR